MRRNGFSLVHLIIYLALFLLIVVLVSSFISTMYKNTFNYNKQVQQKLNLYTAQDLMVKDFREAVSDRKWWIIKDNELIFRMESTKEDVGWIIKKKKLMRYTGVYNRSSDTWRKNIVSMVAYGIDGFKFITHEYPESSHIRFITGRLFSKYLKDIPELTVTLKNKVV